MDIRLIDAPADERRARGASTASSGRPPRARTAAARRAASTATSRHGGHAARARRHLLLPVLLGGAGAHRLDQARRASTTSASGSTWRPADAFGVATFYAMLSLEPRPPRVVHVCDDLACRCRGSDELIAAARGAASARRVSSPADGSATWYRSPCLGQCDRAPAALRHGGRRASRRSTCSRRSASAMCSPPSTARRAGPAPRRRVAAGRATPALRLLRAGRRRRPDEPRRLPRARRLRRRSAARSRLAPRASSARSRTRSLLGRGGAAFPTGRQVGGRRAPAGAAPLRRLQRRRVRARAPSRIGVIMDGDPFALIEAMTIAGYATGCRAAATSTSAASTRWRTARSGEAIEEARRRGFLGPDVIGEGFAFEIEIRKGAGAYICGEETAIFNSIEGFRGEPRNKPPFPVVAGPLRQADCDQQRRDARQRPRDRARRRPGLRRRSAPRGRPGTKLFCVSGHVARPGVYEVPFGATLRRAARARGRRAGGRALQAVLLGGAAGGFVGPDELDLAADVRGRTRARHDARLRAS